jgi:NADPH:quinone reductase-like Zn-dependent oxidoreductase
MLATQVSAFGRPDEVIELIEQPDPGEPGAGEVVVDTELFPINPADLLNLEGRYGATPPPLPMIPGAEGVGRISAVGAGVSHVKAGRDAIQSGGPHAEERAPQSWCSALWLCSD